MPCKRVIPLTILAMLVLGGCVNHESARSEAPAAASVTVQDGRCHAEQAQYTLGKTVTPALMEQAKAQSGAQVVRALKPDDMVTLDYRSERLNLNTDANGVIVRANCG
ncbi:I78 family peptidase inhibitor [Pseudomonas sp. dw_358]|uniref:I78 family peptidase inhibitor n=1 Tax=Pseudomonas sp. dw_358 TaxID=2720083 RepID=UPI001BD49103|nr:I78 family peptidase inhibitor [Pseudomonas sp. dw_358]